MATYQFDVQQKAGSMRTKYVDPPNIFVDAENFEDAKRMAEGVYQVQEDEVLVLVADDYSTEAPPDFEDLGPIP